MRGPKETIVINIFGGPSAGKTGCAWIVAGELKKRGESVEYVSEYAKELVWDEDFELLKDQSHIHNTQKRRIMRLLGKVSYIITDSPILLGIIYGHANGVDIEEDVLEFHNSTKSLNLFLSRNENAFEDEGRLHNLNQSKQIDKKIKVLLKRLNIEYYEAQHENVVDTVMNVLDKS